jgi:signal transduction histidine kinase
VGHEVIGVVVTAHAGSRRVTRDDLAFLEAFADRAATIAVRARAYDQERQSAEQLAQLDRQKGEFLSLVSHELRTPLNAIGGFTELLSLGLGGPITHEQTDYLERIRRSQQHLLHIISDLLNFSRIEAGQLSYDLTQFSLRDAIRTVVPLIEPQARAKGLSLIVEEHDQDCIALADRAKVEQILLNLLSNAVKFTSSPGSVRVSCSEEGDFAQIAVVDTGSGIPQEKLESIFEPFVQLGRSLSSSHEGTGLGLAISRDLARAMSGDLVVTSNVGTGSTFTLSLPQPLTPGRRRPKKQPKRK